LYFFSIAILAILGVTLAHAVGADSFKHAIFVGFAIPTGLRVLTGVNPPMTSPELHTEDYGPEDAPNEAEARPGDKGDKTRSAGRRRKAFFWY
jgi:hypothetical protein